MSTRRPVLFVLSNMRDFGGAERSIAAVLPGLVERARVRVFVVNDRHYEDLQKLAGPELTIERLPKGNGFLAFAATFRALIHAISEDKPDALIANGHKGGLVLAVLDRLLFWKKLRCSVFIRDFDYYFLRWILRALRDAQYFAPTQAIFDYPVYQQWGLGRARCEVIPNAVLPGKPSPAGPLEGPPFLACCARITPWKGIEYLIRAFAEIAAEFPQTQLRIYGEVLDEDYFRSLTALVADRKLEDQVRFEAFTKDIGRVYESGRFFVVPSLSTPPGPESFCRIIIEAWAHARPVVSFDAGGPHYLIRDGEDGFLVEERNVGALAARLRELLAHPAQCDRMGAAGFARVSTEFNPATLSARILDRVLGQPAPESALAANTVSAA
jgi:glycosyltransferase involved in cell wall biosynthesis